MANNQSGKQGENFVREYLRQHGYRVVDKNWSCRYGEVDLIALSRECLCFVEVKTRQLGAVVTGVEVVTKAKQKRIISTAYCYLEKNPIYQALQPRFDVAQVTVQNDATFVIDYFENAFDSSTYSF